MKNAISWFEIPATDLSRAQKSCETVFDINLTPLDLLNIKMRMFPIVDPLNGIGVLLWTVLVFINRPLLMGLCDILT